MLTQFSTKPVDTPADSPKPLQQVDVAVAFSANICSALPLFLSTYWCFSATPLFKKVVNVCKVRMICPAKTPTEINHYRMRFEEFRFRR